MKFKIDNPYEWYVGNYFIHIITNTELGNKPWVYFNSSESIYNFGVLGVGINIRKETK